MRIALFGKAVSPDDAEALRLASDRVLAIDPQAWISRAYMGELSDHMQIPAGLVPYEGAVPDGVDVLLAFGGDGTVLEAGTLVRDGAVPILGVNTGRLGFLSNVSMEAFDLAMDAWIAGKTWEEERALLHVEVDGQTLGDFPYALNEVVIHTRDTASMVVVDVHPTAFVNTYWADGLLVTPRRGRRPTRSSAGGPIVHPGSNVVVVTPVARTTSTTVHWWSPWTGKSRWWLEAVTLFVEHGQPIVPLGARPRGAHSAPGFSHQLVNLEHQDFFHGSAKMHWGLDPRER